MLQCLRIRDLAIIDSLDVELGPGLNVITGETGAGKSILVDALELVLGGKGKPELVRTGSEQAEVEALFDIGDDPHVRERLQELGVDPEEELVVRRVLAAGGRARAYVNGRMVTTAQLLTLARSLADISSQHEHHTLTNPGSHIGYLDAFAKLEGDVATMTEAFHTVRQAREALDELEQLLADRCQREDLLRFQAREIGEVGPRPGEEDGLVEQRDRLKHAATLVRLAGEAAEILYDRDDSLSEQLARVVSLVGEAAALDPSLGETVAELEQSRAAIEEAARGLGKYTREVQADPATLAELEERLHALGRLKRKYGGTLEAVAQHLTKVEEELGALDDQEGASAALEARLGEALEEASERAQALSAARRQAAAQLSHAISEELRALGMGDASVTVSVSPLEGRSGELSVGGARLSASGVDRVELLIAPNKGEVPRPLSRVASGGELSRAMLAIKRVLAGLGPAGMYVFDEVDSGVGGAVAEVIGRKIHEVSRHRQVLCITHLAQIAVFADTHIKVAKRVVDERTVSAISTLSRREQQEEIARMLGGLKITSKTRAAAAEMLKEASAA